MLPWKTNVSPVERVADWTGKYVYVDALSFVL